MTKTYTAWDGESYPWPPPDDWYLAVDGRWWHPNTGPDQTEPASGGDDEDASSPGGGRHSIGAAAPGGGSDPDLNATEQQAGIALRQWLLVGGLVLIACVAVGVAIAARADDQRPGGRAPPTRPAGPWRAPPSKSRQ